MKKINIHSILSNSDNETTIIDTIADYDEKENKIFYTEKDLKVVMEIFPNKIKMRRYNQEYELNLEFKLNEKIRCKYEVKLIGLNLDIDIYTKDLEIDNNIIYINYELFNDNKSIGVFEYKIMIKE